MLLRIEKKIQSVEAFFMVLAVAALFFIMILTCLDASGRYLFNKPLQGAYFLTEDYLMIFLIFLAFGYVQRIGDNISVDLVFQKFSPKVQKICTLFTYCCSMVFFSLAAWQCWDETWENIVNRSYRIEGINWPMFVPWLAASLGLTVLTLRLILQIINIRTSSQPTGIELPTDNTEL